MENKKISFGFNKTVKKTEIVFKREKSAELIDCLEGKSIKVRGGNAVEEVKQPLVIPIKTSNRDLFARIRNGAQAKTDNGTASEVAPGSENQPDKQLTLDELAALELIKDAKNRGNNSTTTTKVFTLPVTEKLILEGEAESTLDDYESTPISDYGMAMLRGMGWKEGQTIGKNPSKTVNNVAPELRPKGLGLGANKLVKANTPKQAVDTKGKELILVKGSFAKIIAGTRRGHYCEVEGFDDGNCRIIVRTTLTKEVLSLNEFLVVPVTKEEYIASSKVINNAKYEEYKEISDKKLKMNRSPDIKRRSRSLEVKREKCRIPEKERRTEVKERSRTPEVKNRRRPEGKRDRSRTPEVKDRRRVEVKKDRSRTPEVKDRRRTEVKKERSRTPEVKDRRRVEVRKERNRSPEVKDRRRVEVKKEKSRSPEVKDRRRVEVKKRSRSPEVRNRNRMSEVKEKRPETKRERSRTPKVKEMRSSEVKRERSRSPGTRVRKQSPEIKQQKASGSGRRNRSSSSDSSDDNRKRGSDSESDSEYERKRKKHKSEKQNEASKSSKKKLKKNRHKSKHRDSDHERERKKNKKQRHQSTDSESDRRDRNSSRRKDRRS